jgi:TPR repeat protein
VNKSLNEDDKLYRLSAEQGDADAQYKLGLAYEFGADTAEAVKWHKKAANQGHAEAQFALGEAYYYGVGAPENKALSFKMV